MDRALLPSYKRETRELMHLKPQMVEVYSLIEVKNHEPTKSIKFRFLEIIVCKRR